MKINIKGKYTFNIPIQGMFLNSTLKISNTNIITNFGESFFLNRMINDNFNPIKYICLGNAVNKPKKDDIKLGNETIRKECVKEVDINKKLIILSANFPIRDIYGTTEIGVLTTNQSSNDVLISHDVYQKLDDTFITPTSGDVNVKYIFNLSTGSFRTGWEVAPNTNDLIYYIVEPNTVNLVSENNGMGYMRVNSKDSLLTTPGAYYYDINSKNLYVRTIDDSNPNDKDIIVQTK